jgi:hypothetical protein
MPPSARRINVPLGDRQEELVAPVEAREVAVGQQRLGGAADLQVEHLAVPRIEDVVHARRVHDQLAVSALRLDGRLPSGSAFRAGN